MVTLATLLHLLTHAQLHYMQYAQAHGYHCWIEVGLHFKHGNVTSTLDDVLCKRR